MPELPEVERARKLLEQTCVGRTIQEVTVREDAIVFVGGHGAHETFKAEVQGRKVDAAARKGKVFWLELAGDGALPVCHFGMNGMLVLRGKQPEWYVRKPRAKNRSMDEWPPKYTKFALRLGPRESSDNSADDPDEVEVAFLDSRRLGRIRLVPQPVKDHPPVSALGFDPILSHPTLEDFTALLSKRSRSTVKGLILDQSFAAGVGNWVADEALFAARIHPACPVGRLSEQEIEGLWNSIRDVCQTAVDVDARHKHFPEHWLFMHRWGKGKKGARGKKGGGMRLPDGRPATIDFCTVGGRTSAYVVEVQKLPEGVEYRPPVKRGKRKNSGSDEESASASEADSESRDSAVVSSGDEKPCKASVKAKASSPSSKRPRRSLRESGSGISTKPSNRPLPRSKRGARVKAEPTTPPDSPPAHPSSRTIRPSRQASKRHQPIKPEAAEHSSGLSSLSDEG